MLHLPRYKTASRVALVASALLMVFWVGDARAQWRTKWLSVGELHHPYLSGGAVPEEQAEQWIYPGIRPGVAYNHWKGLWISAENWTDENGQGFSVRTSHVGPRILGIGEFFDVSQLLLARFEPPSVTVDGFETFLRPVTVEEVDADLDPDRMVHGVINSSVGASVEMRAMQFSNEYHDNYHIIEYTFTNTGNTDGDEEVELPDQTLENVYFTFFDRPKISAPSTSWDNSSGGMAWGQHTMNDAVAPGLNDYDVDFRAQYSWMGGIPEKAGDYNTIGGPMWYNHQWNSVADDTLGRLGAATFAGTVVLHADANAHAPQEYNAVYTDDGQSAEATPDDPAQPRTMTYLDSDWSDVTTGNDHTNAAKMDFERTFIERGSQGSLQVAPEGADPRTWPTHARMVQPDGEYANQTSDPSLGRAGGWGYVNGYGPYTMGPGEQVRIVVAEGVAGLSDDAAEYIGRQYKLSGGDDAAEIAWDPVANAACSAPGSGDCVAMTKNAWVMTSRDSLFQMFERALANYESGYNIPEAPLPPRRFAVTSGTDQILLEWEPYADDPTNGWEIWRAQNNYNGVVTALRVGADGLAIPDEARRYERIATLPGSARSYTDADVERGLSYFYYMQAVGAPNSDPTGNTPVGAVMKSNRYYAQTYEPAFLRREPGQDLSQIRIVPNPYNLAATTDVRFGDKQDKLAFYGLPGLATIKIYTELGELVETIEHTDGSGDEFWFLTTTSRQLIVSGIYIAVIENDDPDSAQFGEQTIQKFIIIR